MPLAAPRFGQIFGAGVGRVVRTKNNLGDHMSLSNEVKKARTEISADGYDMSIGELVNLYKNNEMIIQPEFQRLFRWDISRKTRFIESVLLGIPLPPIFVYQNESGIWELIDGLQRLSTILEFMGELLDECGKRMQTSVMEGTRYLPSLSGKQWAPKDERASIGIEHQLAIKRARVRVEILRQESDPKAKYELFQRLNTGGSTLSEQEVRNCVAVMINKKFFEWLQKAAKNEDFISCTDQTDFAIERQMHVELALRFFVFRNVPYQKGLDVHEYLDEALLELATNNQLEAAKEMQAFEGTFKLLNNSLGEKAFKRWDQKDFKGKFLMSLYEVISLGVSKNLDEILKMQDPSKFVVQQCKKVWENKIFQKNSGAGIRGTTRLSNLLPLAERHFKPK